MASEGMSSAAAAADQGSLFSAAEAQFMADSLNSADRMDPFGASGFRVPTQLPPRLGFGSDVLVGGSRPVDRGPQALTQPPFGPGLQMPSSAQNAVDLVPPAELLSPNSLRAQSAASALLGSRPSWDAQPSQRWTPMSPAGLSAPTRDDASSSDGRSSSRGASSSVSGPGKGMHFVDQFGPSSSLRDVAESLRRKRTGGGSDGDISMGGTGLPSSSQAGSDLHQAGTVGDGFHSMATAANPLGPATGMTNRNAVKSSAVPLSAAALEAHAQVFGPPKHKKLVGAGGRFELASGYGNDPAWQLQQLRFLQEQRDRHLLVKQREQQQQMFKDNSNGAVPNGPTLMQINQAFPSDHRFPPRPPSPPRYLMGTPPPSKAKKEGEDRGKSPSTSGAGNGSANPNAGGSAAPIVFSACGWQPTPSAIEIDTNKAQGKIPTHLQEVFFGEAEFKTQPHLQWLKEMIRSGQMEDPQIKAREAEAEKERERSKRKEPHALLTEAEKKANHIASEQKRRANIKKGYEGLNELVPALRDGEKGEDQGSDDDELDEEEGAKKKKGAAAKDDGPKGGARSEAIVLHQSEWGPRR